MPFFFSGMWMFPMFIMPVMFFLCIFFLYKKGVFSSIISEFNDQKNTVDRYSSNEINELRFEDRDSLEIIKLRYAKGEISKEEYQQLKSDLQM